MLRRLAGAAFVAAVTFAPVAVAPSLSAAHATPGFMAVYTETGGARFTPVSIEKPAPVPVIVQNASAQSVTFSASLNTITIESHKADAGTPVVFTLLSGSLASYTITASTSSASLPVTNIT